MTGILTDWIWHPVRQIEKCCPTCNNCPVCPSDFCWQPAAAFFFPILTSPLPCPDFMRKWSYLDFAATLDNEACHAEVSGVERFIACFRIVRSHPEQNLAVACAELLFCKRRLITCKKMSFSSCFKKRENALDIFCGFVSNDVAFHPYQELLLRRWNEKFRLGNCVHWHSNKGQFTCEESCHGSS